MMLTNSAAKFSFLLRRADALAWEHLPNRMNGFQRFLLMTWLISAAFWPLVLPLGGPASSGAALLEVLAFFLLHLGLAVVVLAVWARLRAKRRIPVPVEAQLEDLGESLVWTMGRRPPRLLAPEAIRQVRLGPDHVFVEAPPELIIIPRPVFGTAQAAEAFVMRWEKRRSLCFL